MAVPVRQRGAVLIVSLVFLVVLTLLGLYLTRSGVLELRMADNAASRSIAFERAERGRIDVEGLLDALADDVAVNGYDCARLGAGHYAGAGATDAVGCGALDVGGLAWNDDDSRVGPGGGRYVVEYLGAGELPDPFVMDTGQDPVPVFVFRITTQGTEASGGTVVLQSVYPVIDPRGR